MPDKTTYRHLNNQLSTIQRKCTTLSRAFNLAALDEQELTDKYLFLQFNGLPVQAAALVGLVVAWNMLKTRPRIAWPLGIACGAFTCYYPTLWMKTNLHIARRDHFMEVSNAYDNIMRPCDLRIVDEFDDLAALENVFTSWESAIHKADKMVAIPLEHRYISEAEAWLGGLNPGRE
jgi:hypothetical protein